MREICIPAERYKELIRLINQKNRHGAAEFLSELCIEDEKASRFLEAIFNPPDHPIVASLKRLVPSARVNYDFSVIDDIDYYNGIVFRGFIPGTSKAVLSGGQYDNLLKRILPPGADKQLHAVGFAVYLKEIERLLESSEKYDADVLVEYDESKPDGREKALEKANELIQSGRTVICAPKSERLFYKTPS